MPADHTPFPALTPSQRLHLEIYGYVVLEKFLTEAEVAALLEVIYQIEADFQRTGRLPGANCHLSSSTREFFRIDNLPHLDPRFYEYLTHPRILGMAEEIVGGTVRLEQSDAHIRRPGGEQKYGFHRASTPPMPIPATASITSPLSRPSPISPSSAPTTAAPPSSPEPTKSPKKLTVERSSTRPWPTPRSSTKSKHRLARRCSFTNR